MSGAVAGLVGGLKAVAAAPVNLVDNPSFTELSITGWSGDDVSRFTGAYKTAPASLIVENPDTDANANYTKLSVLTISTAYSLSFWISGAGNVQASVIVFSAGTTTSTLTIPSRNDSTWTYHKIENLVCSGNTTLQIQFNSPNQMRLDDVSVVAGPTAL